MFFWSACTKFCNNKSALRTLYYIKPIVFYKNRKITSVIINNVMNNNSNNNNVYDNNDCTL